MVRAFRRWLADVPFEDPIERQLAPLAQLVLLGLGLIVTLALILNVLLFGAQAFSLPILGPNAVMMAVVLSALYLLRHRHFKAVNWITVITLLVLQGYHLATIPLYAAAYLLTIFILPIATAGLLISRRALVSVAAASIGLVVLAALNAPPVSLEAMPSPAAMVLVFILITGLFAFLIDLFRASFRHALQAALEHGAAVERRQTENLVLLHETEAQRERLQVTLTSIGDAVITTDAKGNVQFVNPIAEQLTGWSQAESVGQPLETIFTIMDETTRSIIESPAARVLREGIIIGLANHTVLMSRSGLQIPIDDSGAPIRTPDGQLVGTVLVFRDVTAQRDARAALEESERRFRTLADTAPVMIWLAGTDKLCTYFNQPWLDFTGRTLEQEVGIGWADGVHPDDLDRCLQTYVTSFDARREFFIDYRLRRYDGAYHWVSDHGVPRFNAHGSFEGFIGSCIDVTERRQSEERTRLLQQLTAMLSEALTMQQVADAIMGDILTSIGSYLGTVYLLSEDGESLELINRRGLADELVERYRRLPLASAGPLLDAIREKQPLWIETFDQYQERYPYFSEIAARNGSQAIVCVPLIVNQRVIGGASFSFEQATHFDEAGRAFIIALTQQCAQALERARLYEDEAAARKRAEAADKLKVKFLAMISHELRTPLTSIKGFASTLLATDVTWEPQQQREFIKVMDYEADMLTGLVEQLLDVSRMQAGMLRIDAQTKTLRDILDSGSAQFEKVMGAHTLVMNVADDLPPVLADQARIVQVIANLIDNAAKFSRAGSQIVLTVGRDGAFVRVDVSDQGDGIPAEEQSAVFEVFRQVEQQHRQRGAGLGLAICKEVVEAHGGKIWIESQPETGTTISFTLPVANVE